MELIIYPSGTNHTYPSGKIINKLVEVILNTQMDVIKHPIGHKHSSGSNHKHHYDSRSNHKQVVEIIISTLLEIIINNPMEVL